MTQAHRQIKKIFLANRGEISRRIASTARRLGIHTVCPVAGEPPRYLCEWIEEFAELAEDHPRCYLDMKTMVDLALKHRCDAIHPGFGFLSENSQFARACQSSGLIWIGPPPEAMEQMASKATARAIAIAHKVPCLPAMTITNLQTATGQAEINEFVAAVGLPLLVKAALGGGGKGMRIVREPGELIEAVTRASSEAMSSFGDSTLILEKLLEDPRHIEVQILSDQHGHHYTIGDRDCSVQRRHQKIVEESPAPGLSSSLREKFSNAAKRLAEAVGYASAGTVEFLLDTSTSEQFYFLEMNTRLQVEHPVTEEVYGLDLVEWQIRVAQGEPLPKEFESLPARGHSIEVRLYAEDCKNADFLPAAGPIYFFDPAIGPRLRWEVGLDRGGEISTAFDPMFAKVIATGSDREMAATLLIHALRNSVILGSPTNQQFLIALLGCPAFAQAEYGTGFLNTHGPMLARNEESEVERLRQDLAAAADFLLSGAGIKPIDHATPEISDITASVFGSSSNKFAPVHGEGQVPMVIISEEWVAFRSVASLRRGFASIRKEPGKHHCFAFAVVSNHNSRTCYLSWRGMSLTYSKTQKNLEDVTSKNQAGNLLKAPVPGKVISVLIKAGDPVEADQVALIIESMKLEFPMKCLRAGIIASVPVKVGDQVKAGDPLASWQEQNEVSP